MLIYDIFFKLICRKFVYNCVFECLLYFIITITQFNRNNIVLIMNYD